MLLTSRRSTCLHYPDRQPRGHHAARDPHAERSGPDRLRRHSPDAKAAQSLRHRETRRSAITSTMRIRARPNSSWNWSRGDRSRWSPMRECPESQSRVIGLIALAIRHHIPVVPIPGPIGISGSAGGQRTSHRLFPLQRLPSQKSGKRRKLLESVKDSPRTQILMRLRIG